MKKILYAALGLSMIAVSCKKTDQYVEKPLIPSGSATVLDTLVGEITGTPGTIITVTKNTYLYGLVYVKPGVTLKINPGVTIYGSINTNGGAFDAVNPQKNKGTLCIERGAKLDAAGTLTSPIIWTSDNNIAVGNRKFGDWGGIVIYGDAPIHKADGSTSGRFEAFDIVPTDTRNFYGGNTANDNSGVMTYNRIEFAGGVVTAINKEVNGLTLCGVGNGTVMNHIEVIKSGDDAIEWFGGNVNMDHLLTYATKDDDFDFDEGYNGNLQFIVGVRDTTADNSGSHLVEADNDASASTFGPFTAPFISNATLIGPTTAKNFSAANAQSYFEGALYLRRRVSARIVNSYVISNAMPYIVMYTPTTGNAGAILQDPPSLALPGNVHAFNVLQTNNPGFANSVIVNSGEGNSILPGIANDGTIVGKLISANNANNGLTTQADYNLGGTLENTAATPFLNTGVNLAALGLPFVGTTERGGVITTDNWTLAGASSGWISIATK